MLLSQLGGDGAKGFAVAASGSVRTLEKQVGDATHGRDDHGHLIPLLFGGGDNVGRPGNGFGPADRRAAEFHDECLLHVTSSFHREGAKGAKEIKEKKETLRSSRLRG